MKLILAPDSFKGSMTAVEAALAMEKGIRRGCPADWTVRRIPMADGGEGTMTCLVEATGGSYRKMQVQDPLGRLRDALYGLLGDGQTAVIELAESSGLPQLTTEERNPLITSTYGFGELIKAALDAGARRFVLCLGGSATNDAGAGMLQALGCRFLDAAGEELAPGGAELIRLARIDKSAVDPRLAECEWKAACDVDNPLIGPRGASAVFGPQKGATLEMVSQLDKALARFADALEEWTGVAVHDYPGAGAAGGTAAALLALLDADLESGASLCIQASGLAGELENADLVLTGEGRVDDQTVHGKTPFAVAQAAWRHRVPSFIFGGSVGQGIDSLYEEGVAGIFALREPGMDLETAIAHGVELMETRVADVMRRLLSGEIGLPRRHRPRG